MTRYYVTVAALTFVVLAGLGGWIANIVKLVSAADGGITAMLIVRIVGVFFTPLGAVMGYL
jgi:lipopolysaccharide export LptBFGC system permease protein LptF